MDITESARCRISNYANSLEYTERENAAKKVLDLAEIAARTRRAYIITSLDVAQVISEHDRD